MLIHILLKGEFTSRNLNLINAINAVVLFDRYDSRVKAMEVDERPTEQYSDIGGLDKQIQEVDYTAFY